MSYKGATAINKAEIANMFNDYLIDSIQDLSTKIENVPFSVETMDWCKSKFEFEHIDIDELNFIMQALPNKISRNKIVNLQVLRDAKEYIGYFIVNIINQSFTSGVFPEQWKESTIIPIPKRHNAEYAEEFRGINTLPITEKIIESCVHRQLIDHVKYNSILMERQSGYREKHSCETALNLFIDEWKIAIASNKVVIAVFIDFKRAFETIILRKLYCMGIRGISLEWFKSYLETRTQKVKIDEFISESRQINTGIPQGSTLFTQSWLFTIISTS